MLCFITYKRNDRFGSLIPALKQATTTKSALLHSQMLKIYTLLGKQLFLKDLMASLSV